MKELHLPFHPVFELFAFYGAYILYKRLRRRSNDYYDSSQRHVIFIAAAAGAFIGSRVLGLLEHPSLLAGQSSGEFLIYLMQTKTIVGGLLGGIIGVELTKLFYLKTTESSGDLLVYPVMLGMAIGRIGCFLTGVSDATAGLPTNLPWGLEQGDGIYRHPTSLYDIIFLGVLALFLHYFQSRRLLRNGELFKLFIAIYMLYRFLIEFLKPVEILGGLSAIQWACLTGFTIYFILLSKRRMYNYNMQNGRQA